jgi:hypothetical protein
MEHCLTVALETEMTGLNDARMDGANGNFVDFLSFDLEECHLTARSSFIHRDGS